MRYKNCVLPFGGTHFKQSAISQWIAFHVKKLPSDRAANTMQHIK